MYIVIAILLFGLLIFIHELGHFLAARLFGVGVNEFAIGMGPRLLKKQGEKTLYSLRAVPFGGFCEMVGEDEEVDRDDSFSSKRGWQKVIILVAGAAMNLIMGFLLLIIFYFALFHGTDNITTSTTLSGFMEGFPLEGEDGLMVGDTIYKINGERVYYRDNISLLMSLNTGDTMDLVVIRDGEKVQLNGLPLQPREYEYEGKTEVKYGLLFQLQEMTASRKIQYAWYNTLDFSRQVKLSLQMLVNGQASAGDFMGVVGLVDVINDVGSQSASFIDAIIKILYIGALIAVNLGLMNLLPIPGLDGGRLFLMLVTWLFEKITRRRFNPKFEGYINIAGFVLLMALMVFVLYNDIVRIVS